MFDQKYCYTDFHELNLDWLLETYQSIVDEINNINTWVAQHKIEYQDAIARLTAVENEIDTFEARINAEFAKLKEEQTKQLNDALSQMQSTLDTTLAEARREIDEQITTLNNEVREAITLLENEFNELSTEIKNELDYLRVYLNQQIININNSLTANNEYVFEYLENRLDDFIEHFPILVDFPVYNPIKGETTNIQVCINDLYDFARFYGLTATQYDNLGLTASEYDAYELTATEYDQRAYILLGYPDENWYMINPFTGQYTKVKDVVKTLCDIHNGGVTATEYDELELTATEYDAKLINAFDYDWLGHSILIG